MPRDEGVEARARARSQRWPVVLILYSLTSLVEGLGVGQVFSFMPLYLRHMGVAQSRMEHLVGVFGALPFLLGLFLVPLWGVWADKYSRKAVILRSAVVEAAVFALVALSRKPWQLGLSVTMAGFQMGNTGVMLAALRDVTPRRRVGTVIALFSTTTPVGIAVGPVLGGFMIDRLHTSVSGVYWLAAALSLATAIMLVAFSREIAPERRPEGRTLQLAFGAVRGVVVDPLIRRLFSVFGAALLARLMVNPFLPLLVERVKGNPHDVASAIGLVVGTAYLAGALVGPLGGWIGDRVGFRPVLVASLAGAGVSLGLMPLSPSVPVLALIAVVFSASYAGAAAMIFGLLAVEVPPERRSATLNLVYLPLYVVGIIGPAIGAVVVVAGLSAVFFLAGVLAVAGALLVRVRVPGKRAPTVAVPPTTVA
jgi:DHA1 family multidrug resistance protein-like MFS transporter